jgi:membrane-associated phospholipid phosphatase
MPLYICAFKRMNNRMTVKSLFKQNRFFFLCYLILLIFAFFIWILETKKGAFLFLNPFHSDFLDFAFIGITLIGDGFFSIALCIILFIIKRRHLAFMVFASFATSGIFAQILKYFISEARPALLLQKTNYPYFIQNVTLHNFHSFPSGHSTSAFALFAVLSFAVENKKYSFLFLALAALVGYSRIYLGQHFISDVAVGSFIGVTFSIVCWLYFQKYSPSFSGNVFAKRGE